MASHLSHKRCWALFWVCLVTGFGGYAIMVGLGAPPLAGQLQQASHWLARIAPIWLVLWLVAGISAGGVAVRRRSREGRNPSGGISTEAEEPREQHSCPQCGRRLVLRRAHLGQRRGRPVWACPDHGPVY